MFKGVRRVAVRRETAPAKGRDVMLQFARFTSTLVLTLALILGVGAGSSAGAATMAHSKLTASDLGTPAAASATPVAANNSGQVVGSSSTAGNAETHAFSLTQAGGMVDLGTLGGSLSLATAVNAEGTVVGLSYTAGDVEAHAFSWTQVGGMVDLGTLGGALSFANAINANGQLVGGVAAPPAALSTMRSPGRRWAGWSTSARSAGLPAPPTQ
jgi:probable HAF family extracellular repeat protein